MNKISIRGVVVGGVIDIVATVILTLPLVVAYAIPTELTGTLKDLLQAQTAVMATIRASPFLYGLQSAIGLACSVLGGYVAARVAKHDELLNGLLASSLPVALGVYSLATNKDSGPLLLPVLLLIASPLCSGLGGHLRLVQIHGRAYRQSHDVDRREDEIFKRARDALQKIGNGVVDVKQIESIRTALDLQATAKDYQKLTQRSVLGGAPQVFVWKIALSVFFWITALIVIAAVISRAGIDLFGLARKLTSH
jgi:hypothetical protein